MATPSYRDRVAPSLIDTNMPSTGAASAAMQLAQTFKDFERLGTDTVGTLRAEQGRREGAEAGRTNDPALRTGLASMTAYGRAYNDAATRSYAIQSEIAADEAATRLEADAGNDPEVFKATFGARRDATIKAAPPEAQAILAEVYDQRMAAGVHRLIQSQGAEFKERARADVLEGLQRSTDKIGQLRASDDPAKAEEADEEQIKQDMLIEGARRDGTLSETEASTARMTAARAVTAQTVTYRFRNEMDNPYGDPVAFIEKLKKANKDSNALPPEEEEKLVTGLLNELQERNALLSAGQRNIDSAQKVRWAIGDNTATNAMIDGRLTSNKLSQMLRDDEIDPAVARTLHNELQAGSDKPDDERERFYVETTLLEHTEDEIGQNSKLSWKTRRELVDKRRGMVNTWRSTQQATEGAARIDRALKIVPGMESSLLSDAQRRQRGTALNAWYDLVEALPEAERQAKAIELSNEVVDNVIAGNAAKKAETWRRRRAQAISDAGPVEEMGETQRKQFEAEIAKIDARIQQFENQAKL